MGADNSAGRRADAQWLRKMGQSLVGPAPAQYAPDPRQDAFENLEGLDGQVLLTEYEARYAKFSTAPFDADGRLFRLYPGGLTIWSGFPGAGKTTLLRQFICHVLARGSSVFLASLEEHPHNVLVNLAATAAGCLKPNAHQMQWFIDAYAKRFRLWRLIGIASHRELLGVIRKLAEDGIEHAVIDSLMCLDVANDDFEGQRKFANLIATTARAANIHIHLVAHPRKLVSADQEPDINDVAGAREIGGIADNVIFVRRSKNEGQFNRETSAMQIIVRKQRHGSGELPTVAGWFHRAWRQFHCDQFAAGALHYLPEDAYS